MIKVSLSQEITDTCPDLHVLLISCKVKNSESGGDLWEEITRLTEKTRNSFQIDTINKWKPILATRQAYKKLGKDPNRYRPSAEALLRRILRGLPLYRINTLVDIINLVSIQSGFSIGGFDASKINGELVLGVGREGEPYEAIGRGQLNIDGLPVYRDDLGGIGTPTSDEERTKIDIHTTRLLMIVNGYSGIGTLKDTGAFAIDLLKKHAGANEIEMEYISTLK